MFVTYRTHILFRDMRYAAGKHIPSWRTWFLIKRGVIVILIYLCNLGLYLRHLFKTFQNLFGFPSVYLINTPVCENFLERLLFWLKIEEMKFIRVVLDLQVD